MLVAIGVDQLLLVTKEILLPKVLIIMGKKNITVKNLKASLPVFNTMYYQKCAVIYIYIFHPPSRGVSYFSEVRCDESSTWLSESTMTDASWRMLVRQQIRVDECDSTSTLSNVRGMATRRRDMKQCIVCLLSPVGHIRTTWSAYSKQMHKRYWWTSLNRNSHTVWCPQCYAPWEWQFHDCSY